MYSRSISLDVYIYEVNLNKTNKFGVSLENQFVSKYLNASDVSNINLNLGQMSSVTTPGLSTLSFARTFDTAQGEDAKFNKFFLNFLNQFGNTRVLTKPKLQTINGIPVSMKITTKQDYVANIDETLSSDINTNTTNTTNSTNVEKDTIETGFTLGLYPVAQKDGKIKLIVKPLISQLMKIEPYEYGTEEAPKTIQLLTVTEKDFSQIININDGEVAVISGYIYEKDNKTKDTLPFFDSENDTPFDFFTGTKGSSVEKVEMVIAVKATILK
jgi:type II secretory pathway component GspD/PulD (secretin)